MPSLQKNSKKTQTKPPLFIIHQQTPNISNRKEEINIIRLKTDYIKLTDEHKI